MKTSEKVVSAVLTIVLGILLVVLPNRIVEICMTVLGIVLIVSGILNLIDKMVMPAVVKIVVGALIILCGWVLVSAVLYIVAALLLIYGILQLYARIKLKSRARESSTPCLPTRRPSSASSSRFSCSSIRAQPFAGCLSWRVSSPSSRAL